MLIGIAEFCCVREALSTLSTIVPSGREPLFLLAGPAHLFMPCDRPALALFGHCVPQRIWCSTHKSENPADVVDSNLSLRPLEVQPSLGGTNECLSFDVTHEPVPPLPMPTRSGTYLAPETNEHRVPGESNGWHSQGPVRQSQAPRPRSILDYPRHSRSAVARARRRTVPQQTVDSILTTRRSAAISWSPSEQELGSDRLL